ncbi:hypothetical protein BJF89_05375 [Corynebacterium sp. CNJ-954]|nr:hypothetical protein BJF89_05375 [Corynebacterium sp. CNJ-954]
MFRLVDDNEIRLQTGYLIVVHFLAQIFCFIICFLLFFRKPTILRRRCFRPQTNWSNSQIKIGLGRT